MPHVHRLLQGSQIAVDDYDWMDTEPFLGRNGSLRWSPDPANEQSGLELVLVRRGCFLRRTSDEDARLFDPSLGYLRWPGTAQHFAYPLSGDRSTFVLLSAELTAELLHGTRPAPLIRVTPAMHVLHRQLVSDPQEETAVRLAATMLAAVAPRVVTGTRPHTQRARQIVVDQAREVLAANPAKATLSGIARQIGISPHHLSREFRKHTGRTVTKYRQDLRLIEAVDRIAAGADDLSQVAAMTGFSDHSHLTRCLRQQVGLTPTSLRRHIAGLNNPLSLIEQ